MDGLSGNPVETPFHHGHRRITLVGDRIGAQTNHNNSLNFDTVEAIDVSRSGPMIPVI